MQSMPSGREEPSWEPSPGLEKSTPQLLGCSTGQGGHPFPQELPVLAPGHQEKKRGEANFCASVVVKVSFLLSFGFFVGGCLISTSLPCSSALAKTCPGELVGFCFCCSAWLLLGMLKESSSFLISSVSPWEGGRDGRREGFLGQTLCQQHLQSWVGIQGSALPALPSIHGFTLAAFGAKSRFLNSPSPPRLVFERVQAPRRNTRSRFFKTWHHAHPNH